MKLIAALNSINSQVWAFLVIVTGGGFVLGFHKAGIAIDIAAGDIQGAINACSNIWASFPNNAYGQPGGNTMAVLLEKYQEFQS